MNIKYDKGFSFGMGAFETIAVREAIPFFLEAHMERLNKACDVLGFAMPIQKEDIIQYLTEHPLPNHALKVVVSEHNVVWENRENAYTEQDLRRGLHVAIAKIRRNQTSPYVQHKLTNYAENYMVRMQAKNQGYDEALFLNFDGNLAEGSASNFFMVRDGVVYTPPVKEGALPGIVRGRLLELGMAVENEIPYSDLETCSEVFLTNSLMGVMPIATVDQMQFPVHEVTHTVQCLYAQDMAKDRTDFLKKYGAYQVFDERES